MGPATETEETDINKIFEGMERIRKRAKPLRGVTIKELIEEGRR